MSRMADKSGSKAETLPLMPKTVQSKPEECNCVQIKETIHTTPDNSTYLATTLSIISPILVIVGWYVVARTQANRERRKQIREYVSNLIERSYTLERLAIEYHTSERKVSAEHEIISSLTRLETACNSIVEFVARQCFPAVRSSLLEIDAKKIQVLRSAMTLHHFADEHNSCHSHTSTLIQNISLAVFDLIEDLEQIRISALD